MHRNIKVSQSLLLLKRLQHIVSHCSTLTLHHTATHCNILLHTASHCNTLQHQQHQGLSIMPTSKNAATHCSTLQNTATHCSITNREDTATHCNTLQHTAAHCKTLQRHQHQGFSITPSANLLNFSFLLLCVLFLHF